VGAIATLRAGPKMLVAFTVFAVDDPGVPRFIAWRTLLNGLEGVGCVDTFAGLTALEPDSSEPSCRDVVDRFGSMAIAVCKLSLIRPPIGTSLTVLKLLKKHNRRTASRQIAVAAANFRRTA
jgi:hypothetical protein